MAQYMFVVMTNATEGQEEVFNDWYDNQHLSDVLKVEGFRAAQRFKLAAENADNPKASHRYLCLYEIETDDLSRTQAALGAVAGGPAMPLSPSMDMRDIFSVYFKAAGDRVVAR